MARIQKSTSGFRVKRQKIHAEQIKGALNNAVVEMGITSPRFGSLKPPSTQPKSKPR